MPAFLLWMDRSFNRRMSPTMSIDSGVSVLSAPRTDKMAVSNFDVAPQALDNTHMCESTSCRPESRR